MRFGRKGWLTVSLAALIALGVALLVQRSRYRFVHDNADLAGLLPRTEGTLFYADVAKLRAGGYLRFLQGSAVRPDKDYAEFVRETGFDYRSDVDTLGGISDENQVLIVIRGRFHSDKIQQFMRERGGGCNSDTCWLSANTAGRWISEIKIQPDVIGLAVSSDKLAAKQLKRESKPNAPLLSDAALWVKPARKLLSNPAQLPVPVQIFAIALQSADSAILSLRPADESGAAFQIRLNSWFENQAAAETAQTQLELNTKLLKLELIREHKQAARGDLTSLLTSGTFHVAQKELIASWPVHNELIQSLE